MAFATCILFLFLNVIAFTYLPVCVNVHKHSWRTSEDNLQEMLLSFHCRPWGLNSGLQAWLQEYLSTESSYRASISFLVGFN